MTILFTDLETAAKARENQARMRQGETEKYGKTDHLPTILRSREKEGNENRRLTPEKLGLQDEAAGAKLPPVPAKPVGVGPTVIGRYYDMNRTQIEMDIADIGLKPTLKRWGMSNTTWERIEERWKSGKLLTSKSKKPAPIVDLPKRTAKGRNLNQEEKIAIAREADKRGVKVVADELGLDGRAVQAWRNTYVLRAKGPAAGATCTTKRKTPAPPVTGLAMTRQSFLKLPVEERRAFLTEQVETLREVCPSLFVPEPDKMDTIEGQLTVINDKLKSIDDNMANMLPPAMPDEIKEEILYSIIHASTDSRTAAQKVLRVMNALVGL